MEEENGINREIGTICVFGCPLRVLELLYSSCAMLNFWAWHFFGCVCIYMCVFAKGEKGHRPYPLSVDEALPLLFKQAI